jgi:hypothetical protein
MDDGTVLINLIYDGALLINPIHDGAVCIDRRYQIGCSLYRSVDGVMTFIEPVDPLDNAATCIEQTIGHRRQRRSELQARAA